MHRVPQQNVELPTAENRQWEKINKNGNLSCKTKNWQDTALRCTLYSLSFILSQVLCVLFAVAMRIAMRTVALRIAMRITKQKSRRLSLRFFRRLTEILSHWQVNTRSIHRPYTFGYTSSIYIVHIHVRRGSRWIRCTTADDTSSTHNLYKLCSQVPLKSRAQKLYSQVRAPIATWFPISEQAKNWETSKKFGKVLCRWR